MLRDAGVLWRWSCSFPPVLADGEGFPVDSDGLILLLLLWRRLKLMLLLRGPLILLLLALGLEGLRLMLLLSALGRV